MRKRIGGLFPVALGAILLLAVACTEEATPQFPAVPPTPNAQATISALSQQSQSGAPTPTAVPASAVKAAQDFAQSYQAITSDIDQLHQQFDDWQAGLNPCTQTAIQTDLFRFAGQFGSITQSARELTRASASRDLADRLIEAAEAENQALRQLRDNAPQVVTASGHGSSGDSEVSDGEDSNNGNGTNGPVAAGQIDSQVSLSERVDAARSSSSAILREVTDALTDQQERNTAAARESMDEFVSAFQAANTRWDLYHQEYDTFRSGEASLTSIDVLTSLGDLVADFREVMVAVRDLPRLDATQEVAGLMAKAADAEDLALRKLRSTFQKSDEAPSESASDVLDPLSSVDGEDNEPAPKTGSFVADDPTLFSAYESQLVSSNTTRRQALDAMERTTRTLADDYQSGLAAFNNEFQALLGEWNAFHQDYDEWSRTEGGCDREKAVDTLVGFGVQMGQIAASARNLPNTHVLRPLGELLVEAVQREETSLRELSNSWRPFDSSIYQQHHDERLAAGRLTRQVGVGVRDLLEQYGIGPG